MPTRHAIEARTGPVRASRRVTAGRNSQLAVVLDTERCVQWARSCCGRPTLW